MQHIEIYQIDAFTDKVFHGNPAAVCLLSEWLNDELLQAIAVENNLSETAFVIKKDDGHSIRWFTPNGEINLCGHATLAAAFLLFELGNANDGKLCFSSLSGDLFIHKSDDWLTMDFPKLAYQSADATDKLADLVDTPIISAYTSELDYLLQLKDEDAVGSATVDLKALANLPKRGLILTAAGNDVDFYSRCFYPKHHIPEDSVTGSAHCVLAPFWAEQLNKTALYSRQGSFRKGEVLCEVGNDRVYLTGKCRWYFKGHLLL